MSTTATPPSVPVRLTRRGRALLVLLLAGLLLTAFSLGQQDTQAASVVGTQAELQTVTVQPGESLWSVAKRVAPDNDPREVIAQIQRLNDLESSTLHVGQHLLLPVAA